MAKRTKPAKAQDFGLASFLEIFGRAPIAGEVAGSHTSFRNAMLRDLAPFTAHEMVIAENLISIEWELLQHRRMRDQAVRDSVAAAIRKAVEQQKRSEHWTELAQAKAEWVAAGNARSDFEEWGFDHRMIKAAGDDLARRAMDPAPDGQAAAQADAAELGVNLLTAMSEAFSADLGAVEHHEEMIEKLERRRRGVKGDLDALQRARPLESTSGDVTDAEVLDS